MVEVLFGESEAGAMKASKKEEADLVICLGFMLDIGDIKEKADSEYRTVKLPHHEIRPNTIVSYQHWGEVAPEEFAGFLIYEKELSREEISMYSIWWSELKEDNSPLRAAVNGKVIGVPEEFYDFLIWRNLTEKPVKQARLIGDIIGKNRISLNDLWYAKRIDFFIKQGEITIVEDCKNRYARTIKRSRASERVTEG